MNTRANTEVPVHSRVALLISLLPLFVLAQPNDLRLHFQRAKGRTATLIQRMEPRFFGRETPAADLPRITAAFNEHKGKLIEFANQATLILSPMNNPNRECAQVSNWQTNTLTLFEPSCGGITNSDRAQNDLIRAMFAHLLGNGDIGLSAVIALLDGFAENRAIFEVLGTYALTAQGDIPGGRQPRVINLTVGVSNGALTFSLSHLRNYSGGTMLFEGVMPSNTRRYSTRATAQTVSSQTFYWDSYDRNLRFSETVTGNESISVAFAARGEDHSVELTLHDAVERVRAFRIHVTRDDNRATTPQPWAVIDRTYQLRYVGARVNENEYGLIGAAANGNLNEVRRLLDLSVNINAVNHLGETAIALATYSRNAEVVELLLQRGARVDVQFTNGKTLFDGLFETNWEPAQLTDSFRRTLERLLNASTNKPQQMDRALRWAMEKKPEWAESVADLLLVNGGTTASLDIALRFAIRQRNSPLAIRLLRRADLSLKDSTGRTPLFAALEMPPVLDRMIADHSASPDQADNEGITLLGAAIEPRWTVENLPRPIDVRIGNGIVSSTQIQRAVFHRANDQAAMVLLNRNANPNLTSSTIRQIPLTMMVQQSLWPKPELVRLALEKGANPNAVGGSGFKALDWAASLRDTYVGTCRAHEHYNQRCHDKFGSIVEALQRAIPQATPAMVPVETLRNVFPYIATTVSVLNIGRRTSFEITYNYSDWCVQAQTTCGD